MTTTTWLPRAALRVATPLLACFAATTAQLAAQEDPVGSIEGAAAREHVGERVTVCGPVASARYLEDDDGQPTFLNLDRPYPDQSLVVVIPWILRESLGKPEERLLGARICAVGVVEELPAPTGLLRIVLERAVDLTMPGASPGEGRP